MLKLFWNTAFPWKLEHLVMKRLFAAIWAIFLGKNPWHWLKRVFSATGPSAERSLSFWRGSFRQQRNSYADCLCGGVTVLCMPSFWHALAFSRARGKLLKLLWRGCYVREGAVCLLTTKQFGSVVLAAIGRGAKRSGTLPSAAAFH